MLLHGFRCECSGRIYRVECRGVSLPGLLPADEPAYLKPDITPKEIHGDKYYCVCIGHNLLFKDYFFSVDFCGLVFEAAAAGGFPVLTKVDGIATEQGGDVAPHVFGIGCFGVGRYLQRRYGGVPLLLENGGDEDAPGLDFFDVVPGDGKGDVDFHCAPPFFNSAMRASAALTAHCASLIKGDSLQISLSLLEQKPCTADFAIS